MRPISRAVAQEKATGVAREMLQSARQLGHTEGVYGIAIVSVFAKDDSNIVLSLMDEFHLGEKRLNKFDVNIRNLLFHPIVPENSLGVMVIVDGKYKIAILVAESRATTESFSKEAMLPLLQVGVNGAIKAFTEAETETA